MTRYTINIGDDFPLGGDEPPANGDPRDSRHRRGRRHGLFLRVLFFLAVAAIVISHPLHTLLLIGLVLVLRRSPWLAEWRERMRETWRNRSWGRRQLVPRRLERLAEPLAAALRRTPDAGRRAARRLRPRRRLSGVRVIDP